VLVEQHRIALATFQDILIELQGIENIRGICERDETVEQDPFLDDIKPLIASSWACVVPLRIGGGTRLKILEAMSLGTPVISTVKGAEGLDVVHGEHLLIANDAEQFSRQTIQLLTDESLRQKLSLQARRLVEEKYDWQCIQQHFCELVESCKA